MKEIAHVNSEKIENFECLENMYHTQMIELNNLLLNLNSQQINSSHFQISELMSLKNINELDECIKKGMKQQLTSYCNAIMAAYKIGFETRGAIDEGKKSFRLSKDKIPTQLIKDDSQTINPITNIVESICRVM